MPRNGGDDYSIASLNLLRNAYNAKYFSKYEKIPLNDVENDVLDESSTSGQRVPSIDIVSKAYGCVSLLSSPEIRGKILAWICMGLAILSGSSIGPVFKYMELHGIKPLQAASWRSQCMLLWLFPLVLVEVSTSPQKTTWFQRKSDLKFPVIVHVLIAGLFWCISLLAWVIAIQYTTTVRASIMWNIHPLLLVVFLSTTTGNVSVCEWIGVCISVAGVMVAASDGVIDIVSGRHNSNEAAMLFGDVLCLFSGMSEVVIVLNRHRIKPYVPLMQYTFSTTLILGFVSSILSMIFESCHLFCIRTNCIFGWASANWLKFMLSFGLYIGLFCFSGFNYAMQYMSPLVFSSMNLLDPFLTGVFSWSIGVENVPNTQTWLGGLIIISGIAAVTYGEHTRMTETFHSNDDVQPQKVDSTSENNLKDINLENKNGTIEMSIIDG